MLSKKSAVWNFYEKNGSNNSAKCLKCGNYISCKGSTTTGMINHLKVHEIILEKNSKYDEVEEQEPSVKKMKSNENSILKYIERDSLEEILAKCAAEDGFSIYAMKTSAAIKGFVQSRGYTMPKSGSTIMNNIYSFYLKKKNELSEYFLKCKKEEKKFSMTVDEWTDRNMRRYLNVTVHSEKKPYVLGLMKIEGSCDSIKTEKLVEEKLKDFGLTISDDIVASTHDGAAVMQKYGRELEAENQLCFNHCIHLAVLDVFYAKNVVTANENDDSDSSFSCAGESSDCEDFDGNICFENETNGRNSSVIVTAKPNIGKVLSQTKAIVKKFKSSSVKNSILQDYVLLQEKKKLNLILDCKTRWNSLVPMIERFLKLKECIKKALHDFSSSSMYDERNEAILENILKVLKPTEIAVKELSKEEANLLTCEGVFKFLFTKLNEINSDLSMDLITALQRRIIERRNIPLITLLLYLQSNKFPRSSSTKDLEYSSKAATYAYAEKIMKRLFPNSYKSAIEIDDLEPDIIIESNDLNIQLKKTISTLISNTTSVDPINDLKKDFKFFEGTGKLTKNLEMLFQSLITIKPTSTATERVFSITGNFVTKIRCSLSFKSLNSLVFLKYYFINKKI